MDLRSVAGTGPGGKITKEDVEQTIAQRSRGAEEQGGKGAEVALPRPVPNTQYLVPRFQPTAEVTERVPLKGVRAIIADRMGTSVHTTAL